MSGPLYHTDIEQGTDEWHAVKAGYFSASHGAVIMGGLDTSGLADYLKDLAWGRVYGPTDRGFTSKAMEHGTLTEPEGRDWFAFERDVVIEQVGFVEHARIPFLGWSPDGLFNRRKNAIEAKCPQHKAWMEVCRTGKVPAVYRWQCKIGCMVGELDGMEFVSYHKKAGGLIVPIEVTGSEKQQVEERIAILEPKVMQWVDILKNKGGE